MKNSVLLTFTLGLLIANFPVFAQSDHPVTIAQPGNANSVPQTAKAVAVPIIPMPAKWERLEGGFTVNAKVNLFCHVGEATAAALVLQSGLKSNTGLDLKLATLSENAAGGIRLELSGQGTESAEGYTMEITSGGIVLRAGSGAGLFYGVQSLLQLADAYATEPGQALRLPALRIRDEPRYAWRGLMLDESRHFFGTRVVKELLDMMAYLKLNRFHWHLTDAPGWRIEIKAYPKLTSIGARGNFNQPDAPARFYSQAEIREIVEYAQQRHIVVVPEIDMPGHATAATRAYPEYGASGTGRWDGYTFNPGNPQTYVFLENILKEVMELFPGDYLHFGGDEVNYGNKSWSTDPEIVKFTQEQGLTNKDELEQYFVRRMAKYINESGKIAVGWDETANSDINPSRAVIMWWREDKPAVLTEALNKGYSVVLCPQLPCYFDFVQEKAHQFGRHFKGDENKVASITELYRFPDSGMNDLIPAAKAANVLGIQACLWSEMISSRQRLAFMTYPRLAALAEAAWTPTTAKNPTDFRERLHGFYRELDRRKIPSFNVFDPGQSPEPQH